VRELGSHETSGWIKERESCVQWERLCDGGVSHDGSGWIVRKIDSQGRDRGWVAIGLVLSLVWWSPEW